jgi:hypothetical protein
MMCDEAIELFLDEALNRGRFARSASDVDVPIGASRGADVPIGASREALIRQASALCVGGKFADDAARESFDRLMARVEAIDAQR